MAIAFSYTEATNKVVQTGGTSGTPATFADFVTADRAGVDTILLSAGSPASDLALAYAVRPVEDLAILVKCVVANKTPTQTDYIFITGKDWRGAAQTESIDVTAGNGSYTTTKYWSEITTLDCSDNAAGGGVVWADGDLSVTQDAWGVIWDYGGGQYKIDANLDIGNDVASTYFTTKREQLTFSSGAELTTKGNAVFQSGEKVGDWGRGGSCFRFSLTSSMILAKDGDVKLYASKFQFDSNQYLYLMNGDGSVEALNVQFDFYYSNGGNYTRIVFLNHGTATLKDVYVSDSYSIRIDIDGTYENIHTHNTHSGLYGSALIVGAKVTSASIEDIFAKNGTFEIRDPDFVISTVRCSGAGDIIKEQYTCNIHIADKDGADLAGVVVDCEDQFGTAVWAAGTITTGAAGDIAEQIITYKQWVGTSETLTTYSPHKFTISKAGYETMVLDAITVDEKINWHLELLDELAEGDVRDGVAYGEDSEGNLELPAIGDVESGVGFGSNGVEFTGDFEVPPEADVRDGEGYGAGGAEFEGDLDLPAIGDVEKGVQFDSLTKTGSFKKPGEADVRDGEGYGAGDVEFTGTLDLPAEADVEDGVIFDGAAKEGNFEAPAEADVEDGVGYGAGGVEFEGNLELPAEEDVEVGVGYGSLGTEFEGTYLGLKGNNLTAVLEKSVALTGHLEKKVSLTGELKS